MRINAKVQITTGTPQNLAVMLGLLPAVPTSTTNPIWVNRIDRGRFEDTNRLFVPPEHYDLCVIAEETPEYWARRAANQLRWRTTREWIDISHRAMEGCQ